MARRKVPTSAQWILKSGEVMHCILLLLLKRGGTEFYEEMCRIRNLHGLDVEFFAVSNGSCRVWNCGYKPGQILAGGLGHGSATIGANLYGLMLKAAYSNWINGRVNHVFEVPKLLIEHSIPESTYRKTVALISDSSFRYAASVDGGDIYVQGGVTCGELAELLQEAFVDLMAYKVIIICIGTNDSHHKDRDEWDISYKKLQTLLNPLKNHPTTQIIVNTGIGVPGWPNIRAYGRWFSNKLRFDFSCDNFNLCDWSKPSDMNTFIDSKGRCDRYFFANDEKHPNAHGLRTMRHHWCWILPELRCVSLETADSKYPAGTIRDKVRSLRN